MPFLLPVLLSPPRLVTLSLLTAAVLISLQLVPQPARAAEPVLIVTLDQVIEGALQKSTGISEARKNYQDKVADSIEASIIDNPELQADVEHQQNAGADNLNLEFTQPLKFSQLSGARAHYAEVLGQAASTEQKYQILKVINETTSLYMRLWLLQERRKLYQRSTDDILDANKLVKASARAGQTSAAASYLFTGEAAKLQSDTAAIDAELHQVRAELGNATGRNFTGLDLQKPAFSKIPDASILLEFARTHANLRNVVKAQVEAAQQRVAIAEQDAFWPEFAPRLLYSRNTSAGDEQAYGIGVVLRIPLWNQNDAERQRAAADLNRATMQAAIQASLPQAEVIRQLQQGAASLADRADTYGGKILPAYRKSYELTRAMFRQGQINALEMWQVREKLYQTENEGLQAIAETFNARGALELELGGKLEEIP